MAAIEWSPDGDRLASAGNGGTFQLWTAAPLAPDGPATPTGASNANAIAWSADGSRLATARERQRYQDLGRGNPTTVRSLRDADRNLRNVDLLVQGRRRAGCRNSFDGAVTKWDVATGEVLESRSAHRRRNGSRVVARSIGSRERRQ